MTAPVPVLRGRKVEELPAAEVAARAADATRVVVDVGTGDARTAHRLARAQPDWLVVGLDPARDRMVPTAARSARRAERGGAPNLLLVPVAVEAATTGLDGLADEVLVLMPWGRLLHGVVGGEAAVCGGLRRLARPGAALEVTIGTSIWRPPVPRAIQDLPELTPERARADLAPRLLAAGWELEEAAVVDVGALASSTSSWARRLDATAPEAVLHLRARAV